jgi:formate dehydrogenase subunit gamma
LPNIVADPGALRQGRQSVVWNRPSSEHHVLNKHTPAFNDDWDPEIARAIIEQHMSLEGPLLPILHALQERFGFIGEPAVKLVADILNLTRAEVHGVVSFYHDFRREPAGRHVIKICRAEACQSMGCEDLVARLERALGIHLSDTSHDRRITLEEVYCLGNCALSPAVMIDGELHGRATEEKVLVLVEQRP